MARNRADLDTLTGSEEAREEQNKEADKYPETEAKDTMSSDPNSPEEDQFVLDSRSGEISLNKPVERVIYPEVVKEEEDDSDPYADLDNPNVRRLMDVTGRSYDMLGLRHEGDEVLGHMVLVNVDTMEQVRLLPNAKVPAGTYIPVNHLPTQFRERVK